MNRGLRIFPRDAARHALVVLLLGIGASGCGGDRLTGLGPTPAGPSTAPSAPSPPPVSLNGRWLLSAPGRGQCHMNFSAASPAAADGAIRPEGGCPGKFFTSRKWTYEQGNLVIRDHNGQPLANLSASAGGSGGFEGAATSGEPVALLR
jgi:hypothetical protein